LCLHPFTCSGLHFGAWASHIFSQRTPTGAGWAEGAELAEGAAGASVLGASLLVLGAGASLAAAGGPADSAGFCPPQAAKASVVVTSAENLGALRFEAEREKDREFMGAEST
jgi:hypothetical protein